MKYLFIDETSDANNKKYLGVCIVKIDGTKYPSIKNEFLKNIEKFSWDPSFEFKGRWIFSASKGCKAVPVSDRINLARSIIEMNRSDKNARIQASYMWTTLGNNETTYRELVKHNIKAILSKPSKGVGKNLLAVYCDERPKLKPEELRELIRPYSEKHGYVIVEDPVLVKSNIQTVGVCIADIIGYLMSRADNIKVDADLLEDVNSKAARGNMQLKKYLTSTSLINLIKKMDVYRLIREK